jgi:hypothetical protein
MDVVNKIAKSTKGGSKSAAPGMSPADIPTEPILINKATVVDAAAPK